MLKKIGTIFTNLAGIIVVVLSITMWEFAFECFQAIIFCSKSPQIERFPHNYYCYDYSIIPGIGAISYVIILFAAVLYIVYLIKNTKRVK